MTGKELIEILHFFDNNAVIEIGIYGQSEGIVIGKVGIIMHGSKEAGVAALVTEDNFYFAASSIMWVRKINEVSE